MADALDLALGPILGPAVSLGRDVYNGVTGEKPAPAEAEAPAAPTLAPRETPGLVPVTNPDGSTDFVREEDLGAAIEQGSHPATEAEYYSSKMGLPGQLASAAIGIGQGATLGYGVPALVGAAKLLGGDEDAATVRRALRIAKEGNSGSYLLGELLGGLVPAFGGAGAEGEAAAGESLLTRAGRAARAAAPRAVMEGGAIGGGQQLTEDTLGDHDVTAEKMAASIAGGAVFGGLLGTGLAAGGSFVGDLLGGRVYRAGKELAEGAEAEAKPRGAFEWLGRKAEHAADEQAFKATAAKMGDIRRLGATADEIQAEEQRLGGRLRDEGLIGPTTSQEQLAKNITKRWNEVGEELGAMRKRLDTATNERPSLEAIATNFEKYVDSTLAKRLYGAEEAAPATDFLERMIDKGGGRPTFEQLFSFRRELDDKLWTNYTRLAKLGQPTPPGEKALIALRGIVEDEFTTAGERASNEIGDTGFAQKYAAAKSAYADLSTLRQITTKEAARTGGNHAISLTDVIAGGAGHVAGGPIGGLAAAAVNHVRRTYGNQLAATALGTVAKLLGVQKNAAHVDGLIASGVRSFLKGGRVANDNAGAKVTAETVRQIREATRDPLAVTSRIASVLKSADLHASAPKTTQALATTLQRAAAYLQTHAPKESPPVGVSFVPAPPRPPSDTELQKFAAIVDTVNDPMSVVRDLHAGRVSRDKIEALRAVYPRIYDQIRAEVGNQAQELRPELSIQKQIALSVLFGEPISTAMQRSTVAAFQETYAGAQTPDETAPDGGQPMPPRGHTFNRRRGSLASAFDKEESAA